MGRFFFTRSQRLLNAAAYTQVFNNAQAKISHSAFLILANRAEDPEQQGRLGLIAAKKNLKRAVQRNAFKRQVRESFRLHQQQLAGVNIVVMARSGAQNLTDQAFRAEIDAAWDRLNRRLSRDKAPETP